MNSCSRLIILGVGRVDLRISANQTQALFTDSGVHFGVNSSDAAVAASRLTVWLQSSQGQDVQFHHTGIIAGTFIVPNGEIFEDEVQSPGNIYAAFVSNIATFHNLGTFNADMSGLQYTYTSFNNLRSWKDQ
jgi:hypothetical protein